MHPVLRLYEDVLSSAAIDRFHLPPTPRMIFILQGEAAVGGKPIRAGDAWHGTDETDVVPGPEGVTAWRFELTRGDAAPPVESIPGRSTREKLSAFLETMPKGELLMRGDSVAFPPGGGAYLHCHQGPGIRCLIEGGIRIDTRGRSTSYGPGGAWYESGPEPVFAQAADDRTTRFIRVMILPRALLGKSSIQYVNEADKAKPKTQQYKIYVDAPIAFDPRK